MRLKIYFRMCEGVKSVGLRAPRPFGLSKSDLILKSLKSLLDSCKNVRGCVSIEVVDDSSSEEFLKRAESILEKSKMKFKLHKMKFKNNGLSLEYCYKLAETAKEEIVYFCEDDYIHLENVIPAVLEAYNSKIIGTSEFAVHPTDYPGDYKSLYASYLFISKDCHWRSIIRTTGTFFITTRLFREYKRNFYALADFNKKGWGGEEETLNKTWKTVPCLCPIPSLAAHFNITTLPPLIDWKKVVDDIKIN